MYNSFKIKLNLCVYEFNCFMRFLVVLEVYGYKETWSHYSYEINPRSLIKSMASCLLFLRYVMLPKTIA